MSNGSRITVNAWLCTMQDGVHTYEIRDVGPALLGRVLDQRVEIVKTETLRTFDGQAGYTLAQGH